MTATAAGRTAVPDLIARDVFGAMGIFHGPVTVDGRAAEVWPRRVGVVPPLAVGRQSRPADQELAAGAGSTAVVCQVVAGLGGVGKTQLAAHLAERLWAGGQLELLVWITATSRTSVLSGYSLVAEEVIGADDADPGRAAVRLLSWLATTDRRWLVVLDDVTDPGGLTGLWPPDTPRGRTVITTRRRDAALLAGRKLVDVGVFTPDQAVAYLTRLLGDRPSRLDQADRLAADLGHLPLALAQAAAYMRDQDLSCAAYRDRLTRRPLARLRPEVLPDQQHLPVARAWSLSVQAADASSGGLATLALQLAAYLDPNGIPTALFTTPSALGFYRERLGLEVDADLVHDTLSVLYRLSLAETTPDAVDGTSALRVHALIQRTTWENLPAEEAHRLVIAAADAMTDLWPAAERNPVTSRLGHRLRANTTALISAAGPLLWRTRDGGNAAHPVLFRAGTSLGEVGLVAAARDLYQELHSAAVGQLDPGHPDILRLRHHLACWQGEAGDPAGAAGALSQVLADRLRILGPDHPDTLDTRHNLALWRRQAGDPAGAAAEFERLLADRLRITGPDHPSTLSIRHNLALWRGQTGDPAGAAAEFERLLADRLRVLGPDHPDTLSARHNIAYWRGQAGDVAGAVAAFDLLLADRLRLLGPDHPDTLITRHNVALWQGEAGDPVGAAANFGLLLADYRRVLGPDHPETLMTRGNIAGLQGRNGDPAGAAAAFDQLLADYLRVLGPDHPDTRRTRDARAHWQREAGR
ncbi:FxSxx-COOH system tetratricopeptide repeat protein [Actinoplanes sp. NPDC026623]|uniref:FxSxx-COOH system tetratricopeptide repeat protein n=1 Tax=Actinoplanes sp. NPDC026623 TaxID=3155610 RepID=UPI0034106C95